jgi:serine/threonine protein kinase, bacterial
VLIAVAAVLVLVVAGVVTAVVLTSGDGDSHSSAINPTAARTQSTLPFGEGNGSFYPQDVSVDTKGDIYVAAVNDGVFKLAKGATEPTRITFSSFDFALSAGADDAGNVYLSDDGNDGQGRVQKLTPDGTQTELPFSGLGQDPHIAVAPDGTVYVADGGNDRVMKLSPNATNPTELSFSGLDDPRWVAVDSAGTVYVSDLKHNRVVSLESGSSSQKVLPLTVSDLRGVAVDRSGNVYVAGPRAVTVLPKDSQQTKEVPVQNASKLSAIAVDADGNIYVTDGDANQVIALKV